jgi:hypothetical protein
MKSVYKIGGMPVIAEGRGHSLGEDYVGKVLIAFAASADSH